MKLPVFVINYNLMTWPKAMLPHIHRLGGRPIIVDNCSTYKPTLDWYAERPCEIIRLGQNYGHHAPWEAGIIQQYCSGYYAVTDPDLDLSTVPDGALEHLKNGLDRYTHATKCGLSLEINDLPEDSPVKEKALGWETPFWTRRLDFQFWDAPIDTTMAVYNAAKGRGCLENASFLKAVRADRPYTFRHLPFYLTAKNLTEEMYNYFSSAKGESATLSNHLSGMLKEYRRKNPL